MYPKLAMTKYVKMAEALLREWQGISVALSRITKGAVA